MGAALLLVVSLRLCFHCHSNCRACLHERRPLTIATRLQGRFVCVALAPPASSPLCWRSLLSQSTVAPMYVRRPSPDKSK